MGRYLLKRLIATIPVLVLVSITVFSLSRLVPGDPVQILLGEAYDPEVAARLRTELGLDQPIYEQYLTWVGRVLQGDLGNSIRTNQRVSEMVLSRVRPTTQLALLAIVVSLLISFPVGILSAVRPRSAADVVGSVFAFVGVAMPSFLIGLLLIFVFAQRLHWLPTSGFTDLFDNPGVGFRSLVLPGITLGMGLAGVATRMVRSSLLEALLQDYIRTARAKVLAEWRVVLRHGLANAMLPVVTILGLQMGNLMAGAVITETVFAIPGVGRLVVDSIFAHDFPVLQGVVLMTALVFIVSNLVADLAYAALDPRIRLA